MSHPVISGLSADLLPHRQWAVSRWFYANPIWYYHRRGTVHEIRPDGRFYRLVDPALRDVCQLLNNAGVRTTPSCEGHSYQRDHFEQIWEELRREEPLIRGGGLEVKDCENEEAFLFRQSDYQVPWRCFEEFYREASAHQNVGYLGILVPADRPDLADSFASSRYVTRAARLRPDEPIGTLLGGVLFEVRVETTDPIIRAAEWRAFTNYVSQITDTVQCTAGSPASRAAVKNRLTRCAWSGRRR